MKILLADLHRFYGYSGGIESVFAHMAEALAARGHTVIGVYADEKAQGEFFFSIPETVHLYDLYHMDGYPVLSSAGMRKIWREIIRPFSRAAARNENYKILARTKDRLAAILEKEAPDIIVSFREPTGRLLLGGIDTKIPVISMLHNDPDEIFRGVPAKEIRALEKSACIQVLLPCFVPSARKYISHKNIVVIPNAVRRAKVTATPGAEKKTHIVTCVGRLTGRTKRQHLLIEAFAKIADRFPNWTLEFWGDTYDKPYVAKLHRHIESAGLKNRILLCGTTKDMTSVWEKTDIFAFPSHHEGFPLALAEAMSAGIPSIGYNECVSVHDIIQEGNAGLLCENGAEALAIALETLITHPKIRKTYGENAKKSAQKYEADHVWDMWEDLFRICKTQKS